MSSGKTSLFKHFRNYLTGNILTQAISFLSIPIFTQFLDPAGYGVLNLYNSFITLFAVFFTLNTFDGLARYSYEKKKDTKEFFGSNIILTCAVFTVMSIIFITFSSQISNLTSLPKSLMTTYIPVVFYTTIHVFFNQLYLPLEESKKILKLNTMFTIVSFIFKVSLLFVFKVKYLGVIYGIVITDILFSFLIIFDLRKHVKFAFSMKHVKYILSYALPLIPCALSAIILAFFDKIMISKINGHASTGLYGLAYNIGMLMSVVYRALLLNAWNPKYFDYMNSKNYQQHDKDVGNIFIIISLFAISLILFAPPLGVVISNSKFHSGLNIIPLIVLGYTFEAVAYVYLRNTNFAKKTTYTSVVLIFAGVLNVVLNAMFLPKYGYKVGALTTAVSYLFMAFLSWVISHFVLKVHSTHIKHYFKPLLFVFLSIGFYYVTLLYEFEVILQLVLSVVFGLIIGVMLVDKNRFKELLSTFKN